MLKKFVLPILILAIIIQLAVPVGMIAYGKKTEADLQKLGTEYKLEISSFGIYSGEMRFDVDGYEQYLNFEEYGKLYTNDEGKTGFLFTDKKPSDSTEYIRFTTENKEKLSCYYLGEDVIYDRAQFAVADKYMVIKVYDGNLEVVGIYFDNIPIEEWVDLPPETTLYSGEQELLFDDEINGEEENLFGEE